MSRIRSHRRLGAWVALFALALQLVLSFGHVHVGNAAPASSAALAAAVVPGDDAAPGKDPDGGRHDGRDFCAICAALNLAASSVVPTVAALTLPVDHASAWVADRRTAQVAFDLHFIFREIGRAHV